MSERREVQKVRIDRECNTFVEIILFREMESPYKYGMITNTNVSILAWPEEDLGADSSKAIERYSQYVGHITGTVFRLF